MFDDLRRVLGHPVRAAERLGRDHSNIAGLLVDLDGGLGPVAHGTGRDVEGAQGDTIAVRPVGMLAQTFDHRAVDGAYSAAFLRELKSIIETRDWEREIQG